LVKTVWSIGGRSNIHYRVARLNSDTRITATQLFGAEEGREIPTLEAHEWTIGGWTLGSSPGDDAVARSVLLIRPDSRHELPVYNEPPDIRAAFQLRSKWEGVRSFPVRVSSWGIGIEEFLLHIAAEVPQRSDAKKVMGQWSEAFLRLTGREFQATITPWPNVRFGSGPFRQMSSLSAGELDVMVTVGSLLSQQLGLLRVYPNSGAGGFAFIDEVDLRLHPKWQEVVIPLFLDLFPDITFVITTHSPFVLRSLDPVKCRTIRLPDGHQFDYDFRAWPVEDILNVVFDVSEWSQDVAADLKSLRQFAAAPGGAPGALALYTKLRGRGAALEAECRRIVALHGTSELAELLAGSKPDEPLGTAADA
jgi:hypothetical protein